MVLGRTEVLGVWEGRPFRAAAAALLDGDAIIDGGDATIDGRCVQRPRDLFLCAPGGDNPAGE